jgi:hypothetical protein
MTKSSSRQTLDDLFWSMAFDRNLTPFASETRLDDFRFDPRLGYQEDFNGHKAFFDHAVTRSFRRTSRALLTSKEVSY